MTRRNCLEIRQFRTDDGPACHDLRRAVLPCVFAEVTPPTAARTGADSYSVSEFTKPIDGMLTHVATLGCVVAAFCTIREESQRRVSSSTSNPS